jgi:hypothetical protein
MHAHIPLSVFCVASLWSVVVEMLAFLRVQNVVAIEVAQTPGSLHMHRFCLVLATCVCSSESTQRSDG